MDIEIIIIIIIIITIIMIIPVYFRVIKGPLVDEEELSIVRTSAFAVLC